MHRIFERDRRAREAIGRTTTDEFQGVGWLASVSVYRAAHRCWLSLFSE
jgi:hypothetical protein